MVSRLLPSSATFPLSSTGCQHRAVLQPCPAVSSAPWRLPWGTWRCYLVKLLCSGAAVTALLLLCPVSRQTQLSWAPAGVCQALLPPPLAKGITKFAPLPWRASDCSPPWRAPPCKLLWGHQLRLSAVLVMGRWCWKGGRFHTHLCKNVCFLQLVAAFLPEVVQCQSC